VEERGTFNLLVRRVPDQEHFGPVHRITSTRAIDHDCTLGEDPWGNVWVAWSRIEHWQDTRIYRLNPRREIYVRCLDPATGRIHVCDSAEEQHGGRVDIPRGSWQDNVAGVTLHVDRLGAVHLYTRHIHITGDRTKGVYDWGWAVREIVRDGSTWRGPERVSLGEGFSTSPPSILESEDGLLLACQESDNTSGMPHVNVREPNAVPHISLYQVPLAHGRRPGTAGRLWEVRGSSRPSDAVRILACTQDDGEVLIWGDIHRHSDMSKCVSSVDGSAWDHYRWARSVAGLQFYCITDHWDHLNEHEWRARIDLARRFDAPGEFAALLGFEAAGGAAGTLPPGMHVNVYGRDREAAILAMRTFVRQSRNKGSLGGFCHDLERAGLGDRVLVIPHYHGIPRGFPDIGFLPLASRAYIPAVEVVQVRGFAPGLAKALAASDLHVAFTGSSDHASPPWGHAWKLVPWWHYQHAITGLWVKEITVDGVIEGLRRRRAFATNGVKLAVELKIDGHEMGQSFSTSQPPHILVTARATTEISKAQIIRDGVVIHELRGDGAALHATLDDETLPPGEHYYYARVWQEPELGYSYPGEAWTTPIWVHRAG